MDRRTLVAITLCFAIYMGWQKLYLEPRLHAQQASQKNVQPQNTSATAGGSGVPAPTASVGSIPTPQAKVETLTSESGPLQVSNAAQLIQDWTLSAYSRGGAAEITLAQVSSLSQLQLTFEDPAFAYLSKVRGVLTQQKTETGSATVWKYEDAKVALEHRLLGTLGSPTVNVQLGYRFKTAEAPKFAFVSLQGHSPESDAEAADRQLIYFTEGELHATPASKVEKLVQSVGSVSYIGLTSRYFLLALLPQEGQDARALVEPMTAPESRLSLVYPVAQKAQTLQLRAYFGPKDLKVLRSIDPRLDHTVQFGWLAFVAYPLLRLLNGLYDFFHNYGVAIILLTLLIKVVTFPLNYKSMKSMKQMAKMQPQLQKLREKYADDKEALNREMITVMRTSGANPLAGCFPILIQMPIFFALYRVLYSSIELYRAPFTLWIHDLSARDPYYVTPVLLTALMFLQQKMTPQTATDPMQQKMMQFMPVIFGAFMLTLPSGLTLYMLINAAASILQQAVLNKRLDLSVGAAPASAR